MKIINNKETNNIDGYPEEEKKSQIGVIRKNVLDSIEQFLQGRMRGQTIEFNISNTIQVRNNDIMYLYDT